MIGFWNGCSWRDENDWVGNVVRFLLIGVVNVMLKKLWEVNFALECWKECGVEDMVESGIVDNSSGIWIGSRLNLFGLFGELKWIVEE